MRGAATQRNVSSANGPLLDGGEDAAPPAPVVVDDDVSGVSDERIVVSVELAHPVSLTVVVRVTDRRQRTVERALQTNVHLCVQH